MCENLTPFRASRYTAMIDVDIFGDVDKVD